MVIATQNPIEYEGTYPLPEAQLDRFMMRLSLGYPSAEAEESIIHEQTSHDPLAELRPVLHGSEVLAMTQAVTRVRVAPALRRYVVDTPHRHPRAAGDLPGRQPAGRASR